MQVFSSKIESKAEGVSSTRLPLINSIFYKGENQMTAKSISKICSVDGCVAKHAGLGFCNKHYKRWTQTGSLDARPLYNPAEDFATFFWSHVKITADPTRCWEWNRGFHHSGYGHVKYRQKVRNAHVVAWILANGREPDAGLFILHSCDNRPCVNPAHLREGTQAQNMGDMVERGRSVKGERHSKTPLTAQNVTKIRLAYAAGDITSRKLGQIYGVSHTAILDIVRRKHWRHIE